MEQYLIYLRKSRSDLEAEAHGEGETSTLCLSWRKGSPST